MASQDRQESTRSRPQAVLAWCLATAIATAAAGGDLTGLGTQPGLEHEILDPENCSGCHRGYDNDRDIEPWDTWAGSMMAHAGRDPIFWAALDVANADFENAGEFCLRCHAPKAWLEGRASGTDSDGCALEGTLDDPSVGSTNDFSGIACHLCHRMMINDSPPKGEDPVYLENAQFWVDDEDCANPLSPDDEPCRRGPYDYPDEVGEPIHPWLFSEYHTTSAICGNCHNVTHPVNTLIDENGVDTGLPYPIERTYDEWAVSSFADDKAAEFATCQNCHMPDATGPPDVYACIFQELPRDGNLPVHRFVGGNTWVPDVLRQEYASTVGGDRDAELQATVAAAFDLLQNQSAEVEVQVPAEVAPGAMLPIDVVVTNLAGHKLPTGYFEGRRMWLHVTVRDADDDLLYESGAYDDATGVLDDDPDLKVYQSVRGIWNGTTMSCEHTDELGVEQFHFMLNDCIVSDNRIPPLGFTGGDDPEVQPVGYSYPETSPGSGVLVNYDVSTYEVSLPGDAVSPVTVTATLRYQTASKEYVEFLHDQAVDNGFPDDCLTRTNPLPPGQSRGEFLFELWNDYGKSPPVDMVVAADATVLDLQIFDDGFESGDTSAWSNAVGR